MVARNPLEMNAAMGENPLFVFIDSQILERPGRKFIPVLAGDSAGAAA
jgi:hypothetical protein